MRRKLFGLVVLAVTAVGSGCIASTTPGSASDAGGDASRDGRLEGSADVTQEVLCECSGPPSGPYVVAGSATGPCGQPYCEDSCGNKWDTMCGSLGAWECVGQQQAPQCLDAGADAKTGE
jgi:hypothetical protein